MPATGEDPKEIAADPWWKPTLAGIVTIASLVIFGALVIYLLGRVDREEPEWTRSVFLLTGVEAITFAAVGWLFGREVSRKAAEDATKKANEAQEQAAVARETAAEERTRGQSLAAAVEAQAVRAPQANVDWERRGGPAEGGQGIGALADLARRLYPKA